LPREVRRGGALDGCAQAVVADVVEGARQLGRDGERRGHRARDAPLGRALDGLEGPDPEPELTGLDAAFAEARAHLSREERELVRPDAGRHPQEEHASPERHGAGAVGDPGAHGVAPHLEGDGRAGAREPALSGAVEDGLHRLGRAEPLPGASLHREDLLARRRSSVACGLSSSRASC